MLVAAILVLVVAGLRVIGTVSVFALRGYLLDGVDHQLATAAHNAEQQLAGNVRGQVMLPVNFVRQTTTSGAGIPPQYEGPPDDLPPVVSGVAAITARLGRPYTVGSVNHRVRWRGLITLPGDGSGLPI